MALKCGIVGLPNVGKSTLFNALTKAGIAAENYPFCTIEPNVGIVEVPDPRLDALAAIVKPQKILPATVEFVDIAGLVAGASKGEGLGNQFLANIRETDAVAHVVRCFDDENVVHVSGKIDPVSDIETINTELALADLSAVEKQIAKTAKLAKSGNDKEAQRLLVGIHDATRGEQDPANVMREIVARVGMHFDVIRCAYGEVHADDNELLISRGYTRNVPTVAGRYPLNMFGDSLVEALKAGRTAAIDDVRTADLTDSPVAREQFALLHIVSMVCVPLLRAGKLVAILVMADDKPGIARLRDRYRGKMTGTPDGDAFDIITDQTNPGAISFREVAAKVAQLDSLDSFRQSYLNRAKQVAALN